MTFFAIMLTVFGTLVEVAAWSVGLGAILLSRAAAHRGSSLYRSSPAPHDPPSPAIEVPPVPTSPAAEGWARSWESEGGEEEESLVSDGDDDLDLSDLELPQAAEEDKEPGSPSLVSPSEEENGAEDEGSGVSGDDSEPAASAEDSQPVDVSDEDPDAETGPRAEK